MVLKAKRRTSRLGPTAVRRLSFALPIVLVSVLVLLVGGGMAVQASIGCTSCHVMRPFVAAHAAGAHAGEVCGSCHAAGGIAASAAEGVRAFGWALSALAGKRPGLTTVSDGPCRACHDATIAETTEARGIAVRHADFVEQPCTECHAGTAHRLAGRFYRTLEMDDCMGCHKSAADDPTSCELCHVGSAERRQGPTAWRSTHGAGWESTHGMGEIRTCSACHAPRFCIECHGVRIPHPADWIVSHGEAALGAGGPKCVTCHELTLCSGCHGIDMPHPEGFLPTHGAVALESGQDTCGTCHEPLSCDVCHLASSHPNVPGIGMGHGW